MSVYHRRKCMPSRPNRFLTVTIEGISGVTAWKWMTYCVIATLQCWHKWRWCWNRSLLPCWKLPRYPQMAEQQLPYHGMYLQVLVHYVSVLFKFILYVNSNSWRSLARCLAVQHGADCTNFKHILSNFGWWTIESFNIWSREGEELFCNHGVGMKIHPIPWKPAFLGHFMRRPLPLFLSGRLFQVVCNVYVPFSQISK